MKAYRLEDVEKVIHKTLVNNMKAVCDKEIDKKVLDYHAMYIFENMEHEIMKIIEEFFY